MQHYKIISIYTCGCISISVHTLGQIKNKRVSGNGSENFRLKSLLIICTVQSLYNTPHYKTDLDKTRSCCGSKMFLPWKFTKKSIGKMSLYYHMITGLK